MMRRLILLYALLLSACVAGPDYTDPVTMRSIADGAINATSTAVAQAYQDADATARADDRQTQKELARIYAPIQAQETALELSVRAGLATDTAARATESAGEKYARMTATQRAADAALENTQRNRERAEKRADAIDMFWQSIAVIIVVSFGLAAIILAWQLPNIVDRMFSIKVNKRGQVFRIGPNGLWESALAMIETTEYQAKGLAMSSGRPPNFKEIGPNVYSSTPATPDMSEWAMVLVKDSITVLGPTANYLASLEQLQRAGLRYNAERRQAIVDAMESNGIVKGKKGSGVYLVNYDCLDDLYGDFLDGRIKL